MKETLRVLIVDDCEDDQIVLEAYLKRGLASKYMLDIDRSLDALTTITLLEKNDYDMCFLDCKLEIGNGLEFASIMQSLEAKVPMVFVTVDQMDELSDYNLATATVDLFPKSILNPKPVENFLALSDNLLSIRTSSKI